MIQELLVCPYCNAQMPPPVDAPGGRVACARCGETFPLKHAGIVAGEPPTLTDTGIVAGSPPSVLRPDFQTTMPRWLVQLAVLSLMVLVVSAALKFALPDSDTPQKAFPFMVLLSGAGLVASLWLWFLQQPRTNNAIAAFVLANMAAMALLILPFALLNTAFRRGNDPKNVQLPQHQVLPVPVLAAVAPAQLVGLGYLPDDCNFVAGVHVEVLAELELGRQLLTKPAADAEPRPWLIEQGLGFVEKFAGLKAEEIDHLVLGVATEGLIPRLSVVVVTRQRYSPVTLAQTQAPVVPVKHHARDLYQFKMKLPGGGSLMPAGDGSLWCAGDKTLVLMFRFDGLMERDKQYLMEKPRSGPPAPVRELVENRLGPGVPLWWAAADLGQPLGAGNLLPLAEKDSELGKLLLKAKSLAVGLRLRKDPAVLGSVELPQAAAAARAAALLGKQKYGELETPLVTQGQGGLECWVSFQLSGSAEAVVRVLRPVRLLGK